MLTYPIQGIYGVPEESIVNDLLLHFESNKIHVAGLIISTYYPDHSHYLASSSLSQWLVKHKIPALCNVDTRALTKYIRDGGVCMAFLDATTESLSPVYENLKARNLASEVSIDAPKVYTPEKSCGKSIMLVDVWLYIGLMIRWALKTLRFGAF